jgi:site-specific recombinase XerD
VRHPEHAADIQRVLAIPPKRFDKALITCLAEDEITALLAAPDLTTWTGRRDQTLLVLACQTGLRATELTSLAIADIHLGTGAHVSCLGKGRKQRITPLTPATVTIVRSWLGERGGLPADPLFITRRGTPLSRDALERRIAKYTATAATTCPSLLEKKVSPYTLRHSAAMRLLSAGIDVGHRTVDGALEHGHNSGLHPC